MERYKICSLSFRYPDSEKNALNDISFSVGEGEFITVCGLSGSGKSTLLRQLKTCLQPAGERSGEIFFDGKPLSEIDERTQASSIGFVFQSPEHQCVTDKVWHELAFGLEGLGMKQSLIRRRVSEMAAFFGIEKYFECSVDELSGGQKQIVALASVMAMQPSVLILDEPTSRLDPVAAYEFVSLLKRINTELSTSVIICEHSLEEVFSVSDRIIVMSGGRIISDAPPQKTSRELYKSKDPVFQSLPAPSRVYEYSGCKNASPPLSPSQGRIWLSELAKERQLRAVPIRPAHDSGEPILSLRELWFRYEKDTPDVLKGLSLDIHKGEFLTILGGNGSGKTTLLSLLTGMLKPYGGRMKHGRKRLSAIDPYRLGIALLPQEPQALFVCQTVRDELFDGLRGSGLSAAEQERAVREITELCSIESILDTHPFDLSGGEQQKAALAKLLLTKPDILLLDEPSKGLDCFYKRRLADILHSLAESGAAVIAVSHDLEFCASFPDRCALLFNGTIVSCDTPQVFFSENGIYTTSVSRMSKGIVENAVTVPDLLYALETDDRDEDYFRMLLNAEKNAQGGGRTGVSVSAETAPASDAAAPRYSKSKMPNETHPPAPTDRAAESRPNKITRVESVKDRRRLRLIRTGAGIILAAVFIFSVLISAESIYIPFLSDNKFFAYALLFISAAGLMAVMRGSDTVSIARVRESMKSTAVSAVTMLVLVPLTVLFGVYCLDDARYVFISLLVMIESILPFYIMFEKRSVRARELVLIAVLCALSVAGRAVFYMLPECKPVTAIVMISGAALGCEAGAMIGSVSMLASNIFFGQGIWTPWQMFTMGLIGWLSGLLFNKRLIPANRNSLALCGLVFAFVIYGGIMNPSALIMSRTPINAGSLIAAYTVGLPVDTVHALATALFLSFGALPVLTKLERIKRKFGLIR